MRTSQLRHDAWAQLIDEFVSYADRVRVLEDSALDKVRVCARGRRQSALRFPGLPRRHPWGHDWRVSVTSLARKPISTMEERSCADH